MHIRGLIIVLTLIFSAGAAQTLPAADRPDTGGDTFCEQMKKDISRGGDAKTATREKIRAGHDACAVIHCAIAAGGRPQSVIAGAKEAGIASATVSRCAVDACAATNRLYDTGDICSLIRDDINRGMDAKTITRDRIREGHNACPVIRCAIAAGGQSAAVIAGATEAGAAPELASSCAKSAVRDTVRLLNQDTVCSTITQDIARGQDSRKVTRDRLRAGNSACSVIKCVIALGTDLRQVFAGAKDAGISSDVVARCSLDACVDPAMVAAVEQDLGIYGLGYSYYDPDFVPIDTTVPQGTKGRFLSPSKFQ